MPPGDGTREDDYPSRVVRAVAGYVRGQLLFSFVMGAGAGIGLWIFGVLGIFPDGKTYALAFGVWFGLMELVPYVGPFLGAVPPLLVALFQDPITAVWVALLFIGLQQIEGHIASPLIFGHALRINPLLVIFALLFGAELFGIVGALVALPVAAVVRETVVYLRQHLVLEPWGTMTPLEIAEGRSSRMRCPECGGALRGGRRVLPAPAAPTSRARKYRPVGEHGHSQRRGHRGRGRDQALRPARGAARRELRGAARARWSPSSAPTAPARRRCCRSSPGCSRRRAAR